MLYFTLCSSSHRFWFGEYGGLRCCWCSYENWWRTIGEGVFLLISKISTSVSSLYNTIKCYWYSQLSSDEVWMFHFWVCTAFLTEGPLITCVNLKSLLFSFFGCVFSLLIYSFFQFPFFVFRFLFESITFACQWSHRLAINRFQCCYWRPTLMERWHLLLHRHVFYFQ